ncbi:kinase-like protein [Lindgomyces ingoldianus]|uniref:Kinase-like protein n=1 Tax=Lindgomyces ingoldianus TaxID=673940 RepID=A0ACB6R270_9PLEO|nr:kinase-like protein [Lindgomyces ingoldianus]KAF2473419.1 kinase-like protein [Lindgomyces ingoldianus]
MTNRPGSPYHASFETLRDSIYQSLLPFVKLDTEPDKRFFPVDTAEKVLQPDKLEDLFKFVVPEGRAGVDLVRAVKERKLHTFLAILLYSQCRLEAWVRITDVLIAAPTWPVEGNSGQNLAELPLQPGTSRELFGENRVAADLFCNNQEYFCAVVLRKKEEVVCQGHRRVPYLEEVEIGSGVYGKVYRVLVARHHFYDARQQMSNPHKKQLARKDFVLDLQDNAYVRERDVLREIVRNVKQNRNIVENMGSLEIGSTYSLFMPLANDDLETYMEKAQPPTEWKQKAKVVGCAAGIADAIAYLHSELVSDTFETLSCFHMDLKPKNILIFIDPTTGEEEWKLSDFNMSRVRATRRPTHDFATLQRGWTFNTDNVLDFNKLFRRRALDVSDRSNSGSSVGTSRTGTYLAPETRIDGHPILAESDIWSLGCVIIVVFSFLYGGVAAVKKFDSMRSVQPIDAFYTVPRGRPFHKINDIKISEEVERWLKELRSQTWLKDEDEGSIFKEMIAFLQSKVLIIDPLQRRKTTALEVKEQLITSFKAYNNLNTGFVSPKNSRFRTKFIRSSLFPKRTRTESEIHSRNWEIGLPDAVKSCEFGPNAQPLVCVSETTLRAYSLEHVCRTKEFDNLIKFGSVNLNKKNKRWTGNIGVSSQYIVAATNSHKFEVYVYYISDGASHTTELSEVAHVMLEMPPIVKLALSPDDRYVAFLLQEPNSAHGSLYIFRMDQLRLLDADRSSSVTSSSSSSSSFSGAALGRQARPLSTVAPAEDVRELRFSVSNTMYAVVKPKRNNTAAEYFMTIRAWYMENGIWKAHRRTEIEHDGRDDLLQGLYTSFTPHNSNNVFTVLSQEKRVLTRKAWEEGSTSITQSKAKGHRLLKVLSSLDDETIYCFGTNEAKNDLRLLSFPPCPPREEFTIPKGAKLPGMTHQSKFAASLYYPSDAQAAPRALVADINGRTIRILEVPLNPD